MLAGLLAYLSGHREDFGNETMFTALLVVCAVLLLVTLVGYWKVFEKMGEPGWKAIVPIYNNYIIFQRCAEVRQVFWVYGIAAAVEVVANLGVFGSTFSLGIEDWARTIACGAELYMFFEVARCFGQGWKDGVGMWLLEFIFIPRLGFDASEYRGRHSTVKHRYILPSDAPKPSNTAPLIKGSAPITSTMPSQQRIHKPAKQQASTPAKAHPHMQQNQHAQAPVQHTATKSKESKPAEQVHEDRNPASIQKPVEQKQHPIEHAQTTQSRVEEDAINQPLVSSDQIDSQE